MNQRAKHIVYLLMSAILGLLLAIIFWSIVEIKYINWSVSQGTVILDYWESPFVTITLSTAGLIFGLIVGTHWWKIVYVEHRHWRMKSGK